jgi:hypothetical protein
MVMAPMMVSLMLIRNHDLWGDLQALLEFVL